jgi:glycosyltransferase involved in cell wall biosynthesis
LVEHARRAGIPALLFVLDPWPAYGPRHDLWLRMWQRPRLGGQLAERVTGLPTSIDLVHAGRWLFCSETMREQTLATLPDITDSAVISPGVEASFQSASPEPQPPPWRWELLYVGRVVEQKGVRTAIESLPLLPAAATLRIVGDGDRAYRRELERLAAQLGVNGRVRFEPT